MSSCPRFYIYLAAASLGWLIASALHPAQAQTSQPVTVFEDYSNHVQRARELIAVDEHAFGESISLYTGDTTFVQTDVSLAGNSALPVTVQRQYSVGGRDPTFPLEATSELFADWTLMLPKIRTVTGSSQTTPFGWVVSAEPELRHQRCSNFAGLASIIGTGDFLSAFPYESYGNGVHLEVPGQGTQELLVRQDAPVPTDGATYPVVTANFWAVRCLPQLHPQNGQPGEGFEAIAPDGTRYRFDWLTYRSMRPIQRHSIQPVHGPDGQPLVPPADGDFMRRQQAELYATQVTDRFGNWVKYEFDAADPHRLLRIHANDGRELTFSYVPGTRRIQSVSHGTRVWTYQYVPHGSHDNTLLATVTRPDNSQWQFSLNDLLGANVHHIGTSARFCTLPPRGNNSFTGSMTHPSGLVGTFSFTTVRHGRSNVQRICQVPPGAPSEGYLVYPHLFDTVGLISRQYAGPGIVGSHAWTYDYGTPIGSFTSDCQPSCPQSKTVTVTDPVGTTVAHTFGNAFRTTEGLLQTTSVHGMLAGQSGQWLQTTAQRYRLDASGNPYPAVMGQSLDLRNDGTAAQLRPVDQRITSRPSHTLDPDEYVWEAQTFDAFGQPEQTLHYSAVSAQAAQALTPILGPPAARAGGTTQGATAIYFSRTERQQYVHDPQRWVLFQPDRLDLLADANQRTVPLQRFVYDPVSRLPLEQYAFGRLSAVMTYHPNGQLATRSDGVNPPVQLNDYRFGVPQAVTLPDTTTMSAIVDDLGRVTSVTNEVVATTGYAYDPMGRLQRIVYPTEPDVVWLDTVITTELVTTPEFGIAAGHWRRTTATGSAREIEYFDAYGRPLVTRRFDAVNPSDTEQVTVTRFDGAGNALFSAYPTRQITSWLDPLTGTIQRPDGLGRIDRTESASELGPLITQRDYRLALGQIDTDARGTTTQTVFQRFDEPTDNRPVILLAAANRPTPDRILTILTRDDLGKVRAVQRSGHDGIHPSGELFVRDFRHDTHERLCLMRDPEAGLTRFAYDPASNLHRTVEGASLPVFPNDNDAEQCANGTPFPPATTVTRQWDTRHRLTSIDYPGATADIGLTYTLDGRPATESSDGTTWTTTYYGRGQIRSETLTLDGRSLAFGHLYDAVGNLRRTTYPNALAIDYQPNALGQPTQVGAYLSTIRFHASGQPKSGTFANGIQFDATQNDRKLPERVRHVRSIGSAVFDEWSRYDASANVTSIEDHANAGLATRTIAYDWHDRLNATSATGLWGQTTYGYDTADNIRASTQNSTSKTYVYGAQTKRLDAVSASNAPTISFNYDPRGNMTTRGATTLTFDLANRLTAGGSSTHRYDARGKRVTKTTAGKTTLQVYGSNDRLLYEERPLDPPIEPNRIFRNGFESGAATGSHLQVAHAYLGTQLVASEQRRVDDGVPQPAERHFRHVDGLGSPIVTTDANATIMDIERFTPFGEPADGSAGPGPTYTGHVTDADTALVYMGARYYDPAIGRAISIDPEPVDPFTGGNFNRYWYGNNNPYRFTDPDGRTVVCTATSCEGTCESVFECGADYGTVFVVYARTWLTNALESTQHQIESTSDEIPKTPDEVSEEPSFTDAEGNKTPWRGEPGSTVRGGTGSRTYGNDGYPIRDRDLPHPDEAGCGNGDHCHDWSRPSDGGPPTSGDRGPPRLPQPGDPPKPRGPNVPVPEQGIPNLNP